MAYIDDIVIDPQSWLANARGPAGGCTGSTERTVNPAKCHLGLEEANYLGHTVGRGRIKPQEQKVTSIRTWSRPNTKKQVRIFFGLVGYKWQFVSRTNPKEPAEPDALDQGSRWHIPGSERDLVHRARPGAARLPLSVYGWYSIFHYPLAP